MTAAVLAASERQVDDRRRMSREKSVTRRLPMGFTIRRYTDAEAVPASGLSLAM